MSNSKRAANPRPTRQRQTQMGVGSLILIALVYLLQQWLGGGSVVVESAAETTSTPQVAVVDEQVDGKVDSNDQPQLPTVQAAAKPTKKAKATATSTARPQSSKTPTPEAKATSRPAATATKPPKPTPTPTLEARAGPAGMAVIALDELPPEARDTIQLIEQDGPFPYERDGITFQNREGLLPRKPRGYYREYTVITPDSSDRGARRIIAGEEGELYYTEDHYDSFVWVMPE